MKKWEVKQFDRQMVVEIYKKFDISPLTAIVLYNRGKQEIKEVEKFLNINIESLHDPFLMKNMKLTVDRINEIIKNEKHVTIYGDYDVDGITSVTVLYKYLKEKNVNVDYYIPDRIKEGYGITIGNIEKLKQNGTEVIISVDTGISARNEIEYAISLGLEVIVTDHHESGDDLSDICCVIDPKQKDCNYPFKSLAGVGVVFKLLQALEDNKNLEVLFEKYLDFVCLGTVADICPLIDENRFFVIEGLEKIKNTKNIGLKKINFKSCN